MKLSASDLALLADDLSQGLRGSYVQGVFAPTPDRVFIELRAPGASHVVACCAEVGLARVSSPAQRPPSPERPPAWQSVLRRELLGTQFRSATADSTGLALNLLFTRIESGDRTLIVEVGASPGIALVGDSETVLATSRAFRPPVRVGKPWAPSPKQAEGKPILVAAASEMPPLTLARAVEALFEVEERATWERHRTHQLTTALKRLRRTIAKVRAETDRAEDAERLRREGEVLKVNLGRLRRGMTEVTLDTHDAGDTPATLKIQLNPERTPSQEVEWRFRQYRRLTRGREFAARRLADLLAEERELVGKLDSREDGPTHPPGPLAPPTKRKQAPSHPYREYLSLGGQRIWVGKGAERNDSLTFHVAKPFHIWFHARGVPGAHVVVPLGRSAEMTPDCLIDAAHLALHFSDARGEPRAEVSYTPIRYVRRGAAPGQVTYTQEKTVLVRREQDRLTRLLSNQAESLD